MASFYFYKLATIESRYQFFLELIGNVFNQIIFNIINVLINILAVFSNKFITSNFSTA